MSNELAIRSVDDIKELARTMGVSALLPNSLRGKPADVFVTILYGHELGLTPMAAIQGIYVVNGRPQISAQTWLALLRRAGHKASVKHHDAQRCVVWMQRGDTGEEHTSEYTWDEAEQAGLTKKDVWKAHPKAMLLARAVAIGGRFLAPEVALGALVEGEEVTAEPLAEATPPAQDEDVQEAEVIEPEAVAAEVADLAAEFTPDGADEEYDPTLDADWGKA